MNFVRSALRSWRFVFCFFQIFAFFGISKSVAGTSQDTFLKPPASAAPWTWWHWVSGTITNESELFSDLRPGTKGELQRSLRSNPFMAGQFPIRPCHRVPAEIAAGVYGHKSLFINVERPLEPRGSMGGALQEAALGGGRFARKAGLFEVTASLIQRSLGPDGNATKHASCYEILHP
jgi:hypothetical protein